MWKTYDVSCPNTGHADKLAVFVYQNKIFSVNGCSSFSCKSCSVCEKYFLHELSANPELLQHASLVVPYFQ